MDLPCKYLESMYKTTQSVMKPQGHKNIYRDMVL